MTVYKCAHCGNIIAHIMLTEGDSVIAAYEYCNLHGLWKAEYDG